MQAEMNDLYFRLSNVAEKIRQFKEGGSGRRIPDAFKTELAKLTHKALALPKFARPREFRKWFLRPF